MPGEPAVVVGASLAGLRAAEALRQHGQEGPLTVVGAEEHLPYTRPPLSKALLAGAQEAEHVMLESGALDAEWRLGVAAAGLDPDRRRVRLDDGSELPYAKLVLATGSRPRTWPEAGADLDGVFTLRSLGDALALRSALATTEHLAIVGAGFIGCEVAATARGYGVDVTLIDVVSAPMAAFGPIAGQACARLHAGHGVELRLGRGVAAIEGDTRLEAVVLGDGERIVADTALIALGAVPNVEWLRGSGLALRPGVVCDLNCLVAGHEEIAAAGDVAMWPHPLADWELVRVEHWTNAAAQARRAAANLLAPPDERVVFDAVPSFWSDQYDVKVQAVGLPGRAARFAVVEGSVQDGRFVAIGERSGRVVAAVGWNAARRMPWYRRVIGEGVGVADVEMALALDERARARA
jgi:3-phenylpropionate/trans-cinnamate dioxygenase ferredoxin reductase component